MTLTVGSLFSGIGGLDIGMERAGMRVVWQCEIDKTASAVLRRHWPAVPNLGDVRHVGDDTPPTHVVCGGFPCQDVSVAGRRAGLAGERSGLWHEFHRVIERLRPRWVVIENVPGLLSSNDGRDFAVILRGLVECGYGVAWRVLDAQYFGVPQRRRRVFIVASLGDGRAAQVLFEREGVPGDTEPRRTPGEAVAYAVSAGAGGGKFGSGQQGQDTFVVNAFTNRGASTDQFETLRAGSHGAIPMVARHVTLPEEDGLCVATFDPMNVTSAANRTRVEMGQPANTLHQGGLSVISFQERGREGGRNVETQEGLAYALTAPNGGGRRHEMNVATFEPRYYTRDNKTGGAPSDVADITNCHKAGDSAPVMAYGIYDEATIKIGEDVMPTLRSRETAEGNMQTVAGQFGVRRLTPVECERLQGFPDDFTAGHADSARYRMLGNAVAVPVAEWIALRIAAVDAAQDGDGPQNSVNHA